jgi:hypothetical protein
MAWVFLFLLSIIWGDPFPIQFSISETKIKGEIPFKDQDFALLIPGDLSTYIYNSESEYVRDYSRSYYAITTKKGGWDCLRHYEILAAGSIPYFVNLENCPSQTMTLLPKRLILEAMHLPGVSQGAIDHTLFDQKRYFEILEELLAYTRNVLSARKMAETILKTAQYTGSGTILYLSQDPSPDYLRCCTLIGLKELLGNRVIDVPKIEHIYTSYPQDEKLLYGKGFNYTKIVEDLPIDRENIEARIRNREFDLIIYGSVHRGLPYQDTVRRSYPPHKILYFCGEDAHYCRYRTYSNLFLRELSP